MPVLILALLAMLGAMQDPCPQQRPEDYACHVDRWQAISGRMVDLVDELVTRDDLWSVVAGPTGRQEWWDRLTTLADGAPRPTPRQGPTAQNEVDYEDEVAPIRAGLNSLALAMRTARRDDARVALDALRQYLPAACPASTAAGPGRRPLPPQLVSATALDYLEQAVRAVDSDPLVQAYTLGWRCESGLSVTEYLRTYWATRLTRGGERPAPTDDWRAEYAEAARMAAAHGAANVQSAFILTPDLPSLSPGEANVVHTRLYRADVQRLFTGEIDTSGIPRCGLFLFDPTLQDATGAFARLTRIAIQDPRALEAPEWRDCIGAATSVFTGGFQTVDRWAPPAQCVAFHARMREGLGLLNAANEAVGSARRLRTAQPGEQVLYLSAGRNLAGAGAQIIEDAVALDPNRVCW